MDRLIGDTASVEAPGAANKPNELGGDKRGNELSGRDWTRYSISIWSDIRFSAEERELKHPAMFPTMLVDRLIQCFTKSTDTTILDPFMGSGSTLVAARNLNRVGLGFELYDHFADLAERRLKASLFGGHLPDYQIYRKDARQLGEIVPPESVDFCVTSPPYWDILTQARTADYKETQAYGTASDDLGLVASYEAFLDELMRVFRGVHSALRPGKYCVVNVMDLRKKDQFFPYHSDVATRMQSIGFKFDDLIIWDRRQEYNNLRSLGYPYIFRINKVHEYILIFQKRV